MALYKELDEIIEAWGKYLTETESQMQLSIKSILDEVSGNEKVFAMFFEYEYDIMSISFFAFDEKENELKIKEDILDELYSKFLFPVDLMKKQCEVIDEYDGEDENFDDIYSEYNELKIEMFENWFKSCWNAIIVKGYDNVPNAFFSIHDTNYRYNLKTNEEVKDSEIFT